MDLAEVSPVQVKLEWRSFNDEVCIWRRTGNTSQTASIDLGTIQKRCAGVGAEE